MKIGSYLNLSQEAMADNIRKFDKLAENIASGDGSMDNMAFQITEMKQTENNLQANAKVINTMNDMLETLLSMN
jgi:flagellar hook protein FlgE